MKILVLASWLNTTERPTNQKKRKHRRNSCREGVQLEQHQRRSTTGTGRRGPWAYKIQRFLRAREGAGGPLLSKHLLTHTHLGLAHQFTLQLPRSQTHTVHTSSLSLGKEYKQISTWLADQRRDPARVRYRSPSPYACWTGTDWLNIPKRSSSAAVDHHHQSLPSVLPMLPRRAPLSLRALLQLFCFSRGQPPLAGLEPPLEELLQARWIHRPCYRSSLLTRSTCCPRSYQLQLKSMLHLLILSCCGCLC